ncbi:MAG: SDR family NAD(P)-dependent oxidoreductase [Myxococcaceae bacterium]|nr:SDR family NAD(P)-dependent oxidoreductase [Myxococcaceae bacterium]
MRRVDVTRYGPWALVTGASDGIGQAFARELAADGLKLVLVARRRKALEDLARELSPAEVLVVDADLSTEAGVQAVEAAIAPLDVGLFVASAGFGTSGDFLHNELTAELSMLDVNCRAVVSLTHTVGRRLVRRGRGGLVLLSSLVAFQGVKRAAHYAATKAWVQSFAEGLALELAPTGVDVLSVAPGPIASGFAARANMSMSMSATPATVARSSLKALPRGGTVRPGLLSKLLEWSLMFLPRWGRVRAMSQVMAGMTKHQLPAATAAKS